MQYEVYDCLSDSSIKVTSDKKEAKGLQAIHGGIDNCIHVFERPEPVKEIEKPVEPVKKVEYQAQAGFLF